MKTIVVSDRLVRFRNFTFDFETHELFRRHEEIGIRGHPAQILALLLESPGKVVRREALRKSLWPDHTYVDFDHILNNSIQHLREALGDDASTPRFIQTVPGLGYRFVAPISNSEQGETGSSRLDAQGESYKGWKAELPRRVSQWPRNWRSLEKWRIAMVMALAFLLVASALVILNVSP